MADSLCLEYELTAADVAEAVEALIKPDPGRASVQPRLPRVIRDALRTLGRLLSARLARRLLSDRAPGPRTLTLTPAGLEIEDAGRRQFRTWTAVRFARRSERHLVLDARDLWFIVPLHALTEGERASLLLEVSARLPIAGP